MNSKIKVLLVHPEISRTRYNFKGVIENECLELEYISAILKEKNFDVRIYDGQVEEKSLLNTLKKYRPHILYVCGRTRQENFMLEYCHDAKSLDDSIVTIIGGLHAQLSFKRMYRDYVDYILTTFDVYKIADIIECHLNKSISPEKIDGICFKKDGRWIENRRSAFDISRLPLPDRSYFYEHPDNYRYLELEHSAWVRTAYSCPYHCKFCVRSRMNMGRYIRRDIKNVVDEIAEIKSDNIYIVDDDFLFDEERLREFAELIRQKNIHKKFICYGRTDFISAHEDLMAELKEAGLYYVLSGLESITDSRLDSYGKKSAVDNNIRSIEICNRLGINIMGMFIVDTDYTPKDFKNLYKWIAEHNLRHVAISIYTPEMGMETYESQKDRLITDNPSHWDYLHLVTKPEKMGVKRYYFNYYILLIKLFLKAKKEGVYDFLDYNDYIKSFIKNIFTSKRSNDDE